MPPARTINVFKRGCHAIAAAGMHWKMESGLLDLKEKAILLIMFGRSVILVLPSLLVCARFCNHARWNVG